MVDTNLIIDLIFFSVALVSSFFGIMVSRKCKGSLKVAILFLTLGLIFLGFYQIAKILNLFEEIIKASLLNFLHISVIVLILISLINLNQIISKIK